MKKLLFLLVVLFALTNAKAQDAERLFKKFKGEVSLGYGYFPGADIASGLLYTLEPKYALTDQLTIGGKLESAFQYKKFTVNGTFGYGKRYDVFQYCESFSITADYYFTKNYNLRPFAGVGGGGHLVNKSSISSDYDKYDGTSTKFAVGGLVRAGVEIKHFRLAVEYNFVADTKDDVHDYYTNSHHQEVSKNSYIALKAGICFGGGPKNREKKHKG